MPDDRIVAIGLLTTNELALLGSTFDRAWPIEHAPAFPDLLRQIDDADRACRDGKTNSERPVLGGGRY